MSCRGATTRFWNLMHSKQWHCSCIGCMILSSCTWSIALAPKAISSLTMDNNLTTHTGLEVLFLPAATTGWGPWGVRLVQNHTHSPSQCRNSGPNNFRFGTWVSEEQECQSQRSTTSTVVPVPTNHRARSSGQRTTLSSRHTFTSAPRYTSFHSFMWL